MIYMKDIQKTLKKKKQKKHVRQDKRTGKKHVREQKRTSKKYFKKRTDKKHVRQEKRTSKKRKHKLYRGGAKSEGIPKKVIFFDVDDTLMATIYTHKTLEEALSEGKLDRADWIIKEDSKFGVDPILGRKLMFMHKRVIKLLNYLFINNVDIYIASNNDSPEKLINMLNEASNDQGLNKIIKINLKNPSSFIKNMNSGPVLSPTWGFGIRQGEKGNYIKTVLDDLKKYVNIEKIIFVDDNDENGLDQGNTDEVKNKLESESDYSNKIKTIQVNQSIPIFTQKGWRALSYVVERATPSDVYFKKDGDGNNIIDERQYRKVLSKSDMKEIVLFLNINKAPQIQDQSIWDEPTNSNCTGSNKSANGKTRCWLNAPLYAILQNDNIRERIKNISPISGDEDIINELKDFCELGLDGSYSKRQWCEEGYVNLIVLLWKKYKGGFLPPEPSKGYNNTEDVYDRILTNDNDNYHDARFTLNVLINLLDNYGINITLQDGLATGHICGNIEDPDNNLYFNNICENQTLISLVQAVSFEGGHFVTFIPTKPKDQFDYDNFNNNFDWVRIDAMDKFSSNNNTPPKNLDEIIPSFYLFYNDKEPIIPVEKRSLSILSELEKKEKLKEMGFSDKEIQNVIDEIKGKDESKKTVSEKNLEINYLALELIKRQGKNPIQPLQKPKLSPPSPLEAAKGEPVTGQKDIDARNEKRVGEGKSLSLNFLFDKKKEDIIKNKLILLQNLHDSSLKSNTSDLNKYVLDILLRSGDYDIDDIADILKKISETVLAPNIPYHKEEIEPNNKILGYIIKKIKPDNGVLPVSKQEINTTNKNTTNKTTDMTMGHFIVDGVLRPILSPDSWLKPR